MNRFKQSQVTLIAVLAAATLLAGCAPGVPEVIREAPPENPSLETVRANPQQFAGTRVRWGGEIVSVENRADDTYIEIVSRELEKNGRPIEYDSQSQGRFLARIPGFVDPMLYQKGRLLTVVGEMENVVKRPIGKFSYPFPVVRVENYFLWEPSLPPYYYYDPFWYDPWYPYYSPYGYPFGPRFGYPYDPFYRPYW